MVVVWPDEPDDYCVLMKEHDVVMKTSIFVVMLVNIIGFDMGRTFCRTILKREKSCKICTISF